MGEPIAHGKFKQGLVIDQTAAFSFGCDAVILTLATFGRISLVGLSCYVLSDGQVRESGSSTNIPWVIATLRHYESTHGLSPV